MSSLDRILPFLRPIEDLLLDPTVTEVMVNDGGRRVFVERDGTVESVPDTNARNAEPHRRHQEHRPRMRRRDLGRATAAGRAARGRLARRRHVPALCSRRSGPDDSEVHQTLHAGRPDWCRLDHAVDGSQNSWPRSRCEKNILISGGTGTGKTTLLNALAAHIPDRDRIVLIEETAEIHLDKPNVLRLEARRAQAPLGQEAPLPPVTIADLLRAALRHRPDRILVGEVRGAEAFDLLQALNTGHLGSLSTIHANSAEQAFTRLAHCVLTANVGLPHRSMREAIALAIHLVVHIARVGSHRRVTEVVAVRDYDGNADRFVLESRLKARPVPEGAVL